MQVNDEKNPQKWEYAVCESIINSETVKTFLEFDIGRRRVKMLYKLLGTSFDLELRLKQIILIII